MMLREIAGLVLLFFGLLMMIAGSIGLVRLPDFFTRTHAASKVDTVGSVVTLLGIAFLAGPEVDGAKALLAGFLIMLTNPVSAHFLARAAYRAGNRPWRPGKAGPSEKEEG